MPRRLIIVILIVLILGVIGGTVALFVQRLRAPQTVTEPSTEQAAQDLLQQSTSVPDGDTVPDSETGLPSGQTGLPAGQGGLPTAPEQALQIESLFQADLNLAGDSRNLTDVYRNQVPEADRTSESILVFVTAQPIITTLPEPRDTATQLNVQSGAADVSSYLAVAGNTAAFSNRTLLAEALRQLFENQSTSGFVSLAETVKAHQQRLRDLTVPADAENVHRLLLGYTELLSATLQQITVYNEDPVKALVAMRQLQEIDSRYYPLIQQELNRLR